MSRIRSLKPSYNKSLDIAPLSIECRYHFALLWTYADDEGRGIDHPSLIRSELWPLDPEVTDKRVEKWQAELEQYGRIVRYEVAGRRYFQVVNFTEHQKPQKPQESKLPDPSHAEAVALPLESRTATVEVAPVVVGEGRSSSRGEVASAELTVVESPDGFDRFWEMYPRKVAKADARQAWAKAVKRADVGTILTAAAKLRRFYATTEARSVPHATTWLNGDRWQDDYSPTHRAPEGYNALANVIEARSHEHQ